MRGRVEHARREVMAAISEVLLLLSAGRRGEKGTSERLGCQLRSRAREARDACARREKNFTRKPTMSLVAGKSSHLSTPSFANASCCR